MSVTASKRTRGLLAAGWGALTVGAMAVTLILPRWHDLPLYAFWCCLGTFFVVRATSTRLTATLVATGLLLTIVVIARAEAGGGATVLNEFDIVFIALLPMTLAWYGARYRAASVEIAQLNQRAEATLERDRRFVAHLAHELRTPLTIARGHLDMAITDSGALPMVSDLIVADEELKRLSGAIDRLLDLAMVDRDGLKLHPVDLNDLVEDVVRRWHGVANRRWSTAPVPRGAIDLDRERVTTALDALVENAVAFTSDADAIAVTAAADGDHLVVTVHDTGCGIESDRLPTILHSPCASRHDRNRRSGGTGLGLAIVQAVVERHGGTMSVQSAQGEGTNVTMRFPGFRPEWTAPSINVA